MENDFEEIIDKSAKTEGTESESKQLNHQSVHTQTFNEKYSSYSIFSKIGAVSVAVAIVAVIIVNVISFHECTECPTIIKELDDTTQKPLTECPTIIKELDDTTQKPLTECPTIIKELDDTTQKPQDDFKKYWVHARNVKSGYLNNVFLVLERLGYKNDPNATDWDLLWAHRYPFVTLHSKLNNLKPHQKINKFPGSGCIANKVELATSGLKYIPPAFRLPKDKNKLLEYAKNNPNVQFVQKSNTHRNIYLKKIEEINLDVPGTFVQEFVDKPLLVSGHKFDIGIYTILTSVDPLRIYIYNGDAGLRFCPTEYYPFDPNNTNKYVVAEEYLPTWEIPALKHYHNILGFGMKESLNAYLRSEGKDPSVIWEQIEDSIRTVALAKEKLISKTAKRVSTTRNFFEMMRFDFLVNEDLKVFLMEANMSPNLSSAHFPPHQLLFEQVIFNLFGLVGINDRVKKGTLARSVAEEKMQVADKNIAVFATECNSSLCRNSCISPICQLCMSCLSEETKAILVEAYQEHINKGTCKRIFPPSMKPENIDIHEDLKQYSAENQLQYRWFQGKCLMNSSWCV